MLVSNLDGESNNTHLFDVMTAYSFIYLVSCRDGLMINVGPLFIFFFLSPGLISSDAVIEPRSRCEHHSNRLLIISGTRRQSKTAATFK